MIIRRSDLSVRPLNRGDAKAFRTIRLKLLKNEGEKFGPLYENEIKLPYAEWKKRVTPTEDTCIIGRFHRKRIFRFFHRTELVTVTRVTKMDDKMKRELGLTGKVALWGQTGSLEWVRGKRDDKGEKINAPAYEERARFTFEEIPDPATGVTHPRFDVAVAFVRIDNERSRQPLLNFGAEIFDTRPMNWERGVPVKWDFLLVTRTNYFAARAMRALRGAVADAGHAPIVAARIHAADLNTVVSKYAAFSIMVTVCIR